MRQGEDARAKRWHEHGLWYSLSPHLSRRAPIHERPLAHPEPDILVTLGGWEWYQDLLVFTRAQFARGENKFHYEYVDIRLNDVPDSVFVAPNR